MSEIKEEDWNVPPCKYEYLDHTADIHAEPNYIARKVQIEEFDTTAFKIKAKGFGEVFQLGKHPQGTEVKAITFSNMQVHENEGKCEVFVILDI